MGVNVSARKRPTARTRPGVFVALNVIAMALFLRATALHAECLILPPPCDAMNRESIVVLAQVLESTAPWVRPRRPGENFSRHDARLTVLERFKGPAENQ